MLVYNDLMALALMERLRSYGVDVPGQISLVGWDDIAFSGMVTPGLATVRVPRYDMGATAIDLLHGGGQAQTPARIGLPTQFVPRGSIARAAGEDMRG